MISAAFNLKGKIFMKNNRIKEMKLSSKSMMICILRILLILTLLLAVGCGGNETGQETNLNAGNGQEEPAGNGQGEPARTPREGLFEFGGILWRILDESDDKKLLISEYVLDFQPYHDVEWEDITWAESSIRNWLNIVFYNRFSETERARIVETNVINNDNPWVGTAGGEDTVDKIFLLSLEEIVRYFGDSGELAISRGFGDAQWWGFYDEFDDERKALEIEGLFEEYGDYGPFYIPWWLRSPGSVSVYAAFIDDDGSVFVGGSIMVDHSLGIRPAMWIYR